MITLQKIALLLLVSLLIYWTVVVAWNLGVKFWSRH